LFFIFFYYKDDNITSLNLYIVRFNLPYIAVEIGKV